MNLVKVYPSRDQIPTRDNLVLGDEGRGWGGSGCGGGCGAFFCSIRTSQGFVQLLKNSPQSAIPFQVWDTANEILIQQQRSFPRIHAPGDAASKFLSTTQGIFCERGAPFPLPCSSKASCTFHRRTNSCQLRSVSNNAFILLKCFHAPSFQTGTCAF